MDGLPDSKLSWSRSFLKLSLLSAGGLTGKGDRRRHASLQCALLYCECFAIAKKFLPWSTMALRRGALLD